MKSSIESLYFVSYSISPTEYTQDYLCLPESQFTCLFRLRVGYSLKGSALSEDDIEGLYPILSPAHQKALDKVLAKFFTFQNGLYFDARIEEQLQQKKELSENLEAIIEHEVSKRLARRKAGLASAEAKRVAKTDVEISDEQQSDDKLLTNDQHDFNKTFNKQVTNVQQSFNKTFNKPATNLQQTANKVSTNSQQNANTISTNDQHNFNKQATNVQQNFNKESTNTQQSFNKTFNKPATKLQQTTNKVSTNSQQSDNIISTNEEQTGNKTSTNTQQRADVNSVKTRKNNGLDNFEPKNNEPIESENFVEKVDKEGVSSHAYVHAGACTRASESDSDINNLINKNKSVSESESDKNKNINLTNTREEIFSVQTWFVEQGLNEKALSTFAKKSEKNANRLSAIGSILAELGDHAEVVIDRCRRAKEAEGANFSHAVGFVLTSLERELKQLHSQAAKTAEEQPKSRFSNINYREGLTLNEDGSFTINRK